MRFRLDLGGSGPKFTRPEILASNKGMPEALWGVNPRSIEGKAWWDVVRKEAYAKNNFCCWACGVHRLDAAKKQHLEAHEVYETSWKHAYLKFVGIVAVCYTCHGFIHSGRQRLLVAAGKVSKKRLYEVLEHGRAVLGEQRWARYMESLTAIPLGMPSWDKWHLRYAGKKYCKTFSGEIVEWTKPKGGK